MSFKLFEINSFTKNDNLSFISITNSHIRFSSEFVTRVAKISNSLKVQIYVDKDEYKIGFEFLKEGTENCYTLTRPKNKSNFQISSTKILSENNWMKAVAILGNTNRRFVPIKEFVQKLKKDLWVINLSPTFENKISRSESRKIASNVTGIYRYKRVNSDEIVYIGKGNIKDRLNSPERKTWDFDILEYSIINEEENQFRWENYWLEKYKNQNGILPFYNNIGGKKEKKQSNIETK